MSRIPPKPVVWTQQFSVGVKKLDHEHQQLFAMINDLAEHQESTVDSEVIADILERITKYADYHFQTEERIMKEYGYPDYATQVREHTAFKTKIARFCMEAIAGKPGLPGEMLEYLQSWVNTHILESDTKFKDFLIDNGFLPET
jgi:hemerythrin